MHNVLPILIDMFVNLGMNRNGSLRELMKCLLC